MPDIFKTILEAPVGANQAYKVTKAKYNIERYYNNPNARTPQGDLAAQSLQTKLSAIQGKEILSKQAAQSGEIINSLNKAIPFSNDYVPEVETTWNKTHSGWGADKPTWEGDRVLPKAKVSTKPRIGLNGQQLYEQLTKAAEIGDVDTIKKFDLSNTKDNFQNVYDFYNQKLSEAITNKVTNELVNKKFNGKVSPLTVAGLNDNHLSELAKEIGTEYLSYFPGNAAFYNTDYKGTGTGFKDITAKQIANKTASQPIAYEAEMAGYNVLKSYLAQSLNKTAVELASLDYNGYKSKKLADTTPQKEKLTSIVENLKTLDNRSKKVISKYPEVFKDVAFNMLQSGVITKGSISDAASLSVARGLQTFGKNMLQKISSMGAAEMGWFQSKENQMYADYAVATDVNTRPLMPIIIGMDSHGQPVSSDRFTWVGDDGDRHFNAYGTLEGGIPVAGDMAITMFLTRGMLAPVGLGKGIAPIITKEVMPRLATVASVYATTYPSYYYQELGNFRNSQDASNVAKMRAGVESFTEAFIPNTPELLTKGTTNIFKQFGSSAARVYEQGFRTAIPGIGKKALDYLLSTGSSLIQEAVIEEELSLVGNHFVDKYAKKINPDYIEQNELTKESIINTGIESMGQMILTAPFMGQFNKHSDQSIARWKMANNPQTYISYVQDQLKNGAINEKEAVEKIAQINALSQTLETIPEIAHLKNHNLLDDRDAQISFFNHHVDKNNLFSIAPSNEEEVKAKEDLNNILDRNIQKRKNQINKYLNLPKEKKQAIIERGYKSTLNRIDSHDLSPQELFSIKEQMEETMSETSAVDRLPLQNFISEINNRYEEAKKTYVEKVNNTPNEKRHLVTALARLQNGNKVAFPDEDTYISTVTQLATRALTIPSEFQGSVDKLAEAYIDSNENTATADENNEGVLLQKEIGRRYGEGILFNHLIDQSLPQDQQDDKREELSKQFFEKVVELRKQKSSTGKISVERVKSIEDIFKIKTKPRTTVSNQQTTTPPPTPPTTPPPVTPPPTQPTNNPVPPQETIDVEDEEDKSLEDLQANNQALWSSYETATMLYQASKQGPVEDHLEATKEMLDSLGEFLENNKVSRDELQDYLVTPTKAIPDSIKKILTSKQVKDLEKIKAELIDITSPMDIDEQDNALKEQINSIKVGDIVILTYTPASGKNNNVPTEYEFRVTSTTSNQLTGQKIENSKEVGERHFVHSRIESIKSITPLQEEQGGLFDENGNLRPPSQIKTEETEQPDWKKLDKILKDKYPEYNLEERSEDLLNGEFIVKDKDGKIIPKDVNADIVKTIDNFWEGINPDKTNTDIEAKKDVIERRRQEELPIINVYWGSAETPTNTRVLSNLAPRKFTYKNKEYGSVEHAYQTLKSGSFDQATYDKYVKAGGYGTKIRGKAVQQGFDNLQLMRDLVVESFKQNLDQAKLLLNYSDFTHTTNEIIDKAFLDGIRLAQKNAELAALEELENPQVVITPEEESIDPTLPGYFIPKDALSSIADEMNENDVDQKPLDKSIERAYNFINGLRDSINTPDELGLMAKFQDMDSILKEYLGQEDYDRLILAIKNRDLSEIEKIIPKDLKTGLIKYLATNDNALNPDGRINGASIVITDMTGNIQTFNQDGKVDREGLPIIRAFMNVVIDNGKYKPQSTGLKVQNIESEEVQKQLKLIYDTKERAKTQAVSIPLDITGVTAGFSKPIPQADVDASKFTVPTITDNEVKAGTLYYLANNRALPTEVRKVAPIQIDGKKTDVIADIIGLLENPNVLKGEKLVNYINRLIYVKQHSSTTRPSFHVNKNGQVYFQWEGKNYSLDNKEINAKEGKEILKKVLPTLYFNVLKDVNQQNSFTYYFKDGSSHDFPTYGDFVKNIVTVFATITGNSKLNFAPGSFVDESESPFIEDEEIPFEAQQPLPDDFSDLLGDLTSERVDRESPTTEEEFAAYNWFKKSPLSKLIEFRELYDIFNPKAFATFSNDAITLYQGGKYTDLYEEAFHRFTQNFLTIPEKKALYLDVKKRFNLPYIFSNRKVEEILGPNLINYIKAKEAGKKHIEIKYNNTVVRISTNNDSPIDKFFAKIANFLRGLFLQPVPVEEYISQVYNDIYNGNISAKKFNPSNNMFTTLNAGRNYEIGNKVFDAIEANSIVKSIDSILNQIVEDLNNAVNKETGAKLLVFNISLPAIVNLPNSQARLENLYTRAYNKILEHYNKNKEKPFAKDLAIILSNWKQVTAFHINSSEIFGNKYKEQLIEYMEDRMGDDEVTLDYFVNDEDIDPRALADPQVLYMIATLPRYEQGVLYQSKEFGLPEAGDFTRNWNILQKKLSGVENYAEFIKKLTLVAKAHPQFKHLLKQLPDEFAGSLQNLNIKKKFMQAFAKPTIEEYSYLLEDNKEGITFRTSEAGMSDSRRLKTIWDTKFTTKSTESPSKYYNQDEAGNTILNNNILVDFKDINKLSFPQQIQFLQTIGFDFSEKAIDAVSDIHHNRNKDHYRALYESYSRALNDVYNKLESLIDTGEVYSPLTQLTAEHKDKFGNKIMGESKAVNFLLDQEARVNDEFANDMVLRKSGKQVYKITPHSYMSRLAYAINHYSSYAELIKNYPELDYNVYPALKSSLYLNSIFDLNDKKGGLKKKGKNNKAVQIELFRLGSIVQNDEDADDYKDLLPADKLLSDIISFLYDQGGYLNRKQENVRHGDKSTFFGFKVDENNENQLSAIFNLINDNFKGQLIQYIYSEININKTIPDGFKNISKWKNSKVIPFFDITEEEYDILSNDRAGDHTKVLNDIIDRTLSKEEAETSAKLKEAFPGLNNDTNIGDIKFNGNLYGKDGLIYRYAALTKIHNIESFKLFYGDPRNYKSPEDVQKRLSAWSATGDWVYVDEADIAYFNSDKKLSRRMESLYAGERSYTKQVNTSLTKAFNIDKSFLEDIDKTITRLEKYGDKNETEIIFLKEHRDQLNHALEQYKKDNSGADSQAATTLDFYRFYIGMTEGWTQAQEDEYQEQFKFMAKYKEYEDAFAQKLDTEAIKKELDEMLQQSFERKVIFNPKKWQASGAIIAETPIQTKMFYKMSVAPLIPTVMYATGNMEVLTAMLKSSTDLQVDEDGSKLSSNTSAVDVRETRRSHIVIPIDNIKTQLKVEDKFKSTGIFPTQMRRHIEVNTHRLGEIVDNELGVLSTEYTQINNDTVEFEKIKLRQDIDNPTKLVNTIKASFSQLDMPDHAREFLEEAVDSNGKLRKDFDLSLDRDKIEKIFTSIVNKRIVRQKVQGGQFTQIADNLFNKSDNKSSLSWYTIGLDGKVQPAGIRLPFTDRYKPLLNISWKGSRIATVEKLNELLKDRQFIKEHGQKFSMTAARIPVSGPNMLEYLRVEEFLPPQIGQSAVVHPLLTIKSGTDFDFDKLNLQEPSLDYNGNLIELPSDVSNYENVYNKLSEEVSALQVGISEVKDQIKDTTELLSTSIEAAERKELINQLKELNKQIQEEEDKPFEIEEGSTFQQSAEEALKRAGFQVETKKDESKTIQDQIDKLVLKQTKAVNEAKNRNRMKGKEAQEIASKEAFESYQDQIDNLTTQLRLSETVIEEQELSTPKLLDILNEQKEGLLKAIKDEKFKDIKEAINNLNQLYKVFNSYKNKKNILRNLDSTYTKGLNNRLVANMIGKLSSIHNFLDMITPNEIVHLEKLYPKVAKKTWADITSPAYNNEVYENNSVGKRALGIDAKVAALLRIIEFGGLKIDVDAPNSFYPFPNTGNILGHLVNLDGVSTTTLIGEFVSAHVDIAKDARIALILANKIVTPLYLYMITRGTPLAEIEAFLNSSAGRIFTQLKSDNKFYQNIKGNSDFSYTEKLKTKLYNLTGETLKGVKDYADRFMSATPYAVPHLELARQLLIMDQISKQANAMTEVSQALSFDTRTPSTISSYQFYKSEISKVTEYQVDDKGESLNFFDPASVKKMVENSMISALEIADFVEDIYSPYFELTNSPVFNKLTYVVYNEQIKSSQDFDDFAKAFKTEYLAFLFQNYAESIDGEKVFDNLMNKQQLLSRVNNNHIGIQFRNLIAKHPELNENLFVKSFSYDIPKVTKSAVTTHNEDGTVTVKENTLAPSSQFIKLKLNNLDSISRSINEMHIHLMKLLDNPTNDAEYNRQLADILKKIGQLSIIQGGLKKGNSTLNKIIPQDFYYPYLQGIEPKTEDFSIFANKFLMNNPRMTIQKSNIKIDKNFKDYRKTEKVAVVANPFVANTKSSKSIFDLRNNQIEYTAGQVKALTEIAKLIDEGGSKYYLLAGYAGTGKTTIAENIAKYAQESGKSIAVIAPTNKAATVLNEKLKNTGVGTEASTIHKAIYGEPDEQGNWHRSSSIYNSTIIVDESSMVDLELMKDFIESTNNKNNIVIFMGDGFQLEQIGKDSGLFDSLNDSSIFNKNFGTKLNGSSLLTEVKRQALDSSILKVATVIRQDEQSYIPVDSTDDFKITENKKAFEENFANNVKEGKDVAMIVATNNERIVMNRLARNAKFGKDSENILNPGETVISIANSSSYSNSEVFNLSSITNEPEKFEVTIIDNFGKSSKYDVYLTSGMSSEGIEIPLIFLPNVDKPSIYHPQLLKAARETSSDLYSALEPWMMQTKSGKKLSPEVTIATYGYAITAHKSQGSQWDKVFVNQNYTAPTWNAARWFYTAITRAGKTVEVLPSVANVRISDADINAKMENSVATNITNPVKNIKNSDLIPPPDDLFLSDEEEEALRRSESNISQGNEVDRVKNLPEFNAYLLAQGTSLEEFGKLSDEEMKEYVELFKSCN